MPIRSLRGFQRVLLGPGEKRQVRFTLAPASDFAYYDETKKAFAVESGEYEIGVGASRDDAGDGRRQLPQAGEGVQGRGRTGRVRPLKS